MAATIVLPEPTSPCKKAERRSIARQISQDFRQGVRLPGSHAERQCAPDGIDTHRIPGQPHRGAGNRAEPPGSQQEQLETEDLLEREPPAAPFSLLRRGRAVDEPQRLGSWWKRQIAGDSRRQGILDVGRCRERLGDQSAKKPLPEPGRRGIDGNESSCRLGRVGWSRQDLELRVADLQSAPEGDAAAQQQPVPFAEQAEQVGSVEPDRSHLSGLVADASEDIPGSAATAPEGEVLDPADRGRVGPRLEGRQGQDESPVDVGPRQVEEKVSHGRDAHPSQQIRPARAHPLEEPDGPAPYRFTPAGGHWGRPEGDLSGGGIRVADAPESP